MRATVLPKVKSLSALSTSMEAILVDVSFSCRKISTSIASTLILCFFHGFGINCCDGVHSFDHTGVLIYKYNTSIINNNY